MQWAGSGKTGSCPGFAVLKERARGAKHGLLAGQGTVPSPRSHFFLFSWRPLSPSPALMLMCSRHLPDDRKEDLSVPRTHHNPKYRQYQTLGVRCQRRRGPRQCSAFGLEANGMSVFMIYDIALVWSFSGPFSKLYPELQFFK